MLIALTHSYVGESLGVWHALDFAFDVVGGVKGRRGEGVCGPDGAD